MSISVENVFFRIDFSTRMTHGRNMFRRRPAPEKLHTQQYQRPGNSSPMLGERLRLCSGTTKCSRPNGSPKGKRSAAMVAQSDGGVWDDSMGASVAAWHTPPALRATPSTLEGDPQFLPYVRGGARRAEECVTPAR